MIVKMLTKSLTIMSEIWHKKTWHKNCITTLPQPLASPVPTFVPMQESCQKRKTHDTPTHYMQKPCQGSRWHRTCIWHSTCTPLQDACQSRIVPNKKTRYTPLRIFYTGISHTLREIALFLGFSDFLEPHFIFWSKKHGHEES